MSLPYFVKKSLAGLYKGLDICLRGRNREFYANYVYISLLLSFVAIRKILDFFSEKLLRYFGADSAAEAKIKTLQKIYAPGDSMQNVMSYSRLFLLNVGDNVSFTVFIYTVYLYY